MVARAGASHRAARDDRRPRGDGGAQRARARRRRIKDAADKAREYQNFVNDLRRAGKLAAALRAKQE